MKMWAVFDKDGVQMSPAMFEQEDCFCTVSSGNTVQPVVVMREEVYSHVCKLVAHQASYTIVPTHLNEFLKAGG